MAPDAAMEAVGDSVTVGRRISEVRSSRGLTQKELADRLGVSLWAVEELEKGSALSSIPLSRVAEEMGEPIASLLERARAHPPRTIEPDRNEGRVTLSSSERSARNAVLAAVVLLVVIRFFTEVVGLFPAVGNSIDIPLLMLLSAMVAGRSREFADVGMTRLYIACALLFLVLASVGILVNAQRVDLGPALVFIYGFLAPLGFFLCVHRLWPVGHARALVRLIVVLGLLQLFVVALIDLPRFLRDGNPDHISGTFGQNPYQLVFFLLVFVSVLAGSAAFEPRSRIARAAPLLIGATFLVIFLAQYRALLVTTAISVLVIGLLLARARGRGALIAASAVGAFILGFSYVAQHYPTTKFAPTLAAFRETPGVFVRARLEPFHRVFDLYGDRPLAIVTGTGPGTYSSRAWRTFAEVGNSASAEGGTQPYAGLFTNGAPYHTDVSDRYVRPALESRQTLLGSAVARAPFSSYSSLLAEVGIPGFITLLAAYLVGLATAVRLTLAATRRAVRRDPLPALGIACTVAFLALLQMAFLENWLEVARVTVPTWVLLAVLIKESGARGAAA